MSFVSDAPLRNEKWVSLVIMRQKKHGYVGLIKPFSYSSKPPLQPCCFCFHTNWIQFACLIVHFTKFHHFVCKQKASLDYSWCLFPLLQKLPTPPPSSPTKTATCAPALHSHGRGPCHAQAQHGLQNVFECHGLPTPLNLPPSHHHPSHSLMFLTLKTPVRRASSNGNFRRWYPSTSATFTAGEPFLGNRLKVNGEEWAFWKEYWHD